ncbi:MAG TPA: ATP-binding protein [Blastocatellia bacterium]|nr:ATP-binding protein [Blastocatellia bacterium]
MPQQKRNILLIDDDPADRARWREALQLDGLFDWSIVEVEEDAVIRASPGRLPGRIENQFDAILMVSRPTGAYELLAALREEFGGDCPPTLVLTETDDNVMMAQLIGSGAQECLDRQALSPPGLHGGLNRVIERAARQRLLYDRRRQIEEQNLLLEARRIELDREISRRHQAEAAMRESEERFRQFAENIADVFWIGDLVSRRAIYVSPVYEKLWGRSSQAVYEDLKSWLETVHPEDRRRVEKAFHQIKKTGSFSEEYRIIRPDGTVRWIRDRGFSLHKEQGKVVRFASIAEDITDAMNERQQVEAEREQVLQREQEAREMAEAVSRAKDEFIALVSHELRSPLNAMLGWARILKGGSVNADTLAHAVEVIERSARAQQKLIEDLLDAARIIKGKLRLETRPVDIVQVVESATDALRPAAEAKGIELRMAIRENNSIITGDPDRLQQVVWNLLSNAVKFTPEGGQVEVQLERADPYIEIAVSDTGKGIHRDFLPYLFNRFHQGDGSGTHRHGGLGLGLALVRHITELHGGTITAESEGEGRGAIFKVRLPLRALRQQADPQEPTFSLKDSAELYARALEGVRALVVDDEADARDLVATLLRQCGARVTTASSAAEALALLGRSGGQLRPDVLVSDIGMPEEDGYSLIRRVRQLTPQEGGLIPAIALTAYGRASDRIQALSAGFQTHMSKPVEPAELVMVISNLTESAVRR